MLKKYIRILTKSPFQLPYLVWIKIYKKILGNKKNIHFTGKISFIGVPLVDLHDDAALEIGDNVTLTSLNRGYHLNLHSPVKLFANKPGATIKIGENTRIHGTCIHATKSVVIGKNCLIAAIFHQWFWPEAILQKSSSIIRNICGV
ncbi:MAG: hypothetical protein B6D59_01840 [Campylobacteraceae bacterium 4484_4]|nr:MAG: hypothetical protein B6D59_01840 [Campylobacteraceae bacterium 4484_4]